MKTKNTLKMFEVLMLLLLFVPSVAIRNAFGALVDEHEAIAVADLWYAMELNSPYAKIDKTERAARFDKLQNRQVFYLVSKDDLLDSRPDKVEVLAYVVTYEPTGFVIVSGEDGIKPIVVFDAQSEFRWDQPERNFLRYFLGNAMVGCWENLRTKTAKGLRVDVHPNWSYVRSMLQENIGIKEVTYEVPAETIYVLWDTALWDQGQFYNDVVMPNNGNICDTLPISGRVICIPTGCTATAMAIKMRFHEWPATGNSSHSYTDPANSHEIGTCPDCMMSTGVGFSHTVNFGNQSYNWANMPTASLTTANNDVADLMYHCGVAVDMDYEVCGSGAWPTASSMNTFFRYKGTEERGSGDAAPMKASIRGRLPVVCSSSAHTVVADGYRDTATPYWHLNCGWNGTNNGWYDIDLNFPGGDASIDVSYPYCQPNNYIYVDAAWPGAENGNIQNPYNTISEGVSSVPPSGHLWLKAGSYTGAGNVPITISKALTITIYEGTATIGP